MSTQEFTLSGLGTYGGVALVGRYNITLFNQLFGPTQGVTTKIFQNLASRIVYAKGAYVQYANNSVAYAVWLQGPSMPSLSIICYRASWGAAWPSTIT